MRIAIYHPFQKVWTPRTPDSDYDSLGPVPETPIVPANPMDAQGNLLPFAEGIGLGMALESGQYVTQIASRSSAEGSGLGIRFLNGTYTQGARTQITLDAINPDNSLSGGPAFTLACQSSTRTFQSGDIIYFNAVAQSTVYVGPQALTCTIAATATSQAGVVPVQVKSASGALQSTIQSFTIT